MTIKQQIIIKFRTERNWLDPKRFPFECAVSHMQIRAHTQWLSDDPISESAFQWTEWVTDSNSFVLWICRRNKPMALFSTLFNKLIYMQMHFIVLYCCLLKCSFGNMPSIILVVFEELPTARCRSHSLTYPCVLFTCEMARRTVQDVYRQIDSKR